VLGDDDPLLISPGDELPPFERSGGLANWNRFAAVNDEFLLIHMDEDAGRRAGQRGAFGMGNLTAAWLHALLREWARPRSGTIREVAVRFSKPALPGPVLCTARVTGVGRTAEGTRVEIALRASDGDGDALATATAVIVMPATA
jgi:acyl dehydratase